MAKAPKQIEPEVEAPAEEVVEAPAEPEAPKGKPLADHDAYRVDH